MVIDFQPLLQGAVFSLVDNKAVGDRRITTFCFNNQQPLTDAVEAIILLLQQNPGLIPIFSMNDLPDQLSNNHYLVLNDRRVCLKNKIEIPFASLEGCFDEYFSGAMMTVPVRCSNNQHVFERTSLEYYRLNYRCLDGTPSDQHPCPAETVNDPHLIGDGNVDNVLQDQIDQIHQKHLADEQKVKNFFEKLLNTIGQHVTGSPG